MIKIRVARSHVWEALCGPWRVEAVVSLGCRYRSLLVAYRGSVVRLMGDEGVWTLNTPWGSWRVGLNWSTGPGTSIF
jgi:hypothetical protein